MIAFLLQSIVFALIGLQLRGIPSPGCTATHPGIWSSTPRLVTLAVIVVRFAWIMPTTYPAAALPRRIRAATRSLPAVAGHRSWCPGPGCAAWCRWRAPRSRYP